VVITYSRVDAHPSLGPCLITHVVDMTAHRAAQLEMLEALEPQAEIEEPVDIGAVVQAAIDSIRPIAQGHQLALQTDVNVAGAQVSGHAVGIERVLLNLLDNAVKFTPPGGAVDAQARVRDDVVIIDVTDTGIGIPPEEQDRVFDQFYRAREAAEHAIPGAGLGLSIAKAITDQHAGAIKIFSEPGVGSTFTLTLPLRAQREPGS
jgi:two-component system, OmpR family, phosphate regulon sensor histidine kinase PhoR